MGKFIVERSVEIDAPVAEVWSRLLNVRSWPEWKPFIKSAAASSDIPTLGLKIKMRIRVKGPTAIPISVTVCEFDEHKRIAWKGGIPKTVVSVHSFIFENKGGKTIVTSREEFSGALVKLMLKLITQTDLESFHDNWLAAIKLRVEKNSL